MVRQGPVGTGAHDDVEGHRLRALLAHRLFQVPRHLRLGHAGLNRGTDLVQGAIGDLDSPCQQGKLVFVLGGPDLVDQVRGLHQRQVFVPSGLLDSL